MPRGRSVPPRRSEAPRCLFDADGLVAAVADCDAYHDDFGLLHEPHPWILYDSYTTEAAQVEALLIFKNGIGKATGLAHTRLHTKLSKDLSIFLKPFSCVSRFHTVAFEFYLQQYAEWGAAASDAGVFAAAAEILGTTKVISVDSRHAVYCLRSDL